MRRIGLVGGLGVGAAMHYYKHLSDAFVARGAQPGLVISHADIGRAYTLVQQGALDELAASGRALPSQFSYRNFDQMTTGGIEVSVDARLGGPFTGYANYTWQADPSPRGFDISELNLPSTHKANLGGAYEGQRLFGSVATSVIGSAFWQDVLDSRFHGYTGAYALVDAAAGTEAFRDHHQSSTCLLRKSAATNPMPHVPRRCYSAVSTRSCGSRKKPGSTS